MKSNQLAVKFWGFVICIFLLSPMVCNAAPQMTPQIKASAIKIPLGIFIFLLLLVLFWGLKGSKKREFHEDAFSLRITKGIQGFCAAGIMLHHLAQTVTEQGKTDKGIINYMGNIGVFFVGMFFFCSGYGLYTSLKNKPDYLKGFLRKRLLTILVPFYVGNTIFVLTAILFGARFKTGELISLLTGWVLLNTQLWYIVEIFILYIAFYLLFKLNKNRLSYILMGVFVAGLMGFSLSLGHDFKTVSGGAWLRGEWWYNGVFLFFIGITFARYYDSLMKNIKKYYLVWLSISLVGSGVFYFLTEHMLKTKGYWIERDGYPGYLEKIETLSCQLPMIIFMVTAFFLITLKLQFKNRVLDFLGKISLELYIIHNLFIVYLRSQIKIGNDFIFILSVYVLSISMAVLLYAFDRKIISLFTGRKKGGGSGGSLKEKPAEAKREHLIDCMRLLMAFLVVFIHAPFGGKAGELVFCFGKAAVPFFIVVSGYFCYSIKREQFAARLKKQAVRLFMLCAGANFLYVYLYLIGGKLGWMAADLPRLVTEKSLVGLYLYNQSPVADHLWFLGSLFYALILLLVLVKLRIDRFIMPIAPILLGIYIVLSYIGKGDAIMYRNALLVTLPYFMMGCLIRKYRDKILSFAKPSVFNITTVIFVALVVAEYIMRKDRNVPYLSIEVLIYFIVIFCLRYSKVGKGSPIEWLGSKCTLFVYIVHMSVLWVLWYLFTGFSGRYPALVTVLAFVAPLAVSAVIEGVRARKRVRVRAVPE